MVKVGCLLCGNFVLFDPFMVEGTVKEMLDDGVSWETMKVSLDRRLCKDCTEEALG